MHKNHFKFKSIKGIKDFKVILAILAIPLILGSCITYEKTAYLQDIPQEAPLEAFQIKAYTLQPGDMVFVRFLSIDPNATNMFNVQKGNTAMTVQNEVAMQLQSFLVNTDGTMDLPFIGNVEAKGKTLYEVKVKIKAELDGLLNDADVVVKLVNKKISVLGEVNRPGQYFIYRDNITIYEALAMAGDVKDFGDRTRIRLIRNTPSGPLVKTFSTLDQGALTQENLVMPNDILFVDPMKEKVFGFKEVPWSLLLSTVSTTILLLNYIN